MKRIFKLLGIALLSTLGLFSLAIYAIVRDAPRAPFATIKAHIEAGETEKTLQLLEKHPEALRYTDRHGQRLIDFAISDLNDDLLYVTRFDLINALLDEEFFGQKLASYPLVLRAVFALSKANDELKRVDLPEKMRTISDRHQHIELLDRILSRENLKGLPDETLLYHLAMSLCDKEAIALGQHRALTHQAAEKLVFPEHMLDMFKVYVRTELMDADCVDQLVSKE